MEDRGRSSPHTCSAAFLTLVLESLTRRRSRARFSLAATETDCSLEPNQATLKRTEPKRTVAAGAVGAADLHGPERQRAVGLLLAAQASCNKQNPVNQHQNHTGQRNENKLL